MFRILPPKLPWNSFLHEAGTFFCVFGLVVVKVSWYMEIAHPSLRWILGLSIFCALVKIALYLNFGKKKSYRKMKETSPEISTHLAHEILTIAVAYILGRFAGPLLQSAYEFDRYINPGVILALLVFFLIYLKFLLWSKAIHLPTWWKKGWKKNWQSKKLPTFWQQHNGHFVTGLIATGVIGLCIGMYLYESNYIFKFAEYYPDKYIDITKDDQTSLFIIWGEHDRKERYNYRSFSGLWMDPFWRPYFHLWFLLFILCILYKILHFQGDVQETTNLSQKPKGFIGKRIKSVSDWIKNKKAERDRIRKNIQRAKKQPSKPRKPNKNNRLAPTMEHPTKRKVASTRSLGATKEHRLDDKKRKVSARTQEYKVGSRKTSKGTPWWHILLLELLFFWTALGWGLYFMPKMYHTFWYKRQVYAFSLEWFFLLIPGAIIMIWALLYYFFLDRKVYRYTRSA